MADLVALYCPRRHNGCSHKGVARGRCLGTVSADPGLQLARMRYDLAGAALSKHLLGMMLCNQNM